MSKTKIVIPFADNKSKNMLHIFKYLIHIGVLILQDVPAKLSVFQNGGDLVLEIPSDKISDLIWFLKDSGVVVKPKKLYTLINEQRINRTLYSSYRVLQTSWGIAIDITGTLEEALITDNQIIVSADINEDTKKEIVKGLKSVILDLLHCGKKFSIEIKKVEYNIVDFQFDALYWASRDWLSKALKIDIVQPKVSYDIDSNKYLFLP